MRSPIFALIAAVLAGAVLAGLVVYLAQQPTRLRVAVGPVQNEDVRLIATLADIFRTEDAGFRLRLVLAESFENAAAKLEAGEVDLAVVRSDIAVPRNGGSVVELNRDMVMILAPGGHGVASLADLRGKALGVFRGPLGNLALARQLLDHSRLTDDAVMVVPVPPGQLAGMLERGEIDALMAVGPIDARPLLDAIGVVAAAGEGEPVIVPITDAAALERRFTALEAELLPRGLFGGAPARPPHDVPTVSVSRELVARQSLSENTVSDLAKAIMAARPRLAADVPLAGRIALPDKARVSPIPIHQGTIVYIDGQTSNFMERYGEWIYIGLMGLGFAGSLVAGYVSLAARRDNERALCHLKSLQALLGEARSAETVEALDDLDRRADALLAEILGAASEGTLDTASMLAFSISFEHLRRAIVERRKRVSEPDEPLAASPS